MHIQPPDVVLICFYIISQSLAVCDLFNIRAHRGIFGIFHFHRIVNLSVCPSVCVMSVCLSPEAKIYDSGKIVAASCLPKAFLQRMPSKLFVNANHT